MSDSVFTKIIRGEIPCEKIYEDHKNVALLTIKPVQPGHTLVVPKKQIDHLWDLSDEDYQSLLAAAKKVANRMRQVLDARRVGIKVEGVEVPHAHIHLIPFNTVQDYNQPAKSASAGELAKMAKKLAF